MPKTIQIRNVPDSTYWALRSRATQTGQRIRRRSALRRRLSSVSVIRRHRGEVYR